MQRHRELTRCLGTLQNPHAKPGLVDCSHRLPNVGNEGHTYLQHIVQHWDTLPDLLVFLPDTVEYGDKLKTWRRVKVRDQGAGAAIACAHRGPIRLTFPFRGRNSAIWSATGGGSTTRMTTRR